VWILLTQASKWIAIIIALMFLDNVCSGKMRSLQVDSAAGRRAIAHGMKHDHIPAAREHHLHSVRNVAPNIPDF